MPEKILALHPDPKKQGVNISASKYYLIRQAIEAVLTEHEDLTFGLLVEAVADRLGDTFEGSVPWYVTVVKLDLEARGMLMRVAGSSPQRLRLCEPV